MARTTSSNGSRLASLLALGCTVAMMTGSASAATHIVGGSYGWQVHQQKTFFEDWAKSQTFNVGDQLYFPYSAGSDNILSVKKVEFDQCTQNDPIEAFYIDPTTINLTKPGDYYYITSFGKHCDWGQKLRINVPPKPNNRRRLLDASSPDSSPAPGPASSAAGTTAIGAATIISGIAASLWM